MPVREYSANELVEGKTYRVEYYDNTDNLHKLIHSSLSRIYNRSYHILSFRLVKFSPEGGKPYKWFDTPKNTNKNSNFYYWRFFETGENITDKTDKVLRHQAIQLEFSNIVDDTTARGWGDGWF
jgi:hypothetical protein